MTATYHFLFQAVTWVANKKMATIYNNGTSIIKVRKVWMTNIQTGNVTGGICQVNLGVWTGGVAVPTGGATQASVLLDSTSAAFPATVDVRTGATANVPTETLIRGIARANDEVTAGGNTLDELSTIHAWNVLWDAGYGDPTGIQPLTIRQNEGFSIYTPAVGGTYVGSTDIEITVTVE